MALDDLCSKLLSGQNSTCTEFIKSYYQQIVLIPYSDIATHEILKTDFESETPVCKYGVQFTLKSGKKGYRFSGPKNGRNFYLKTAKTNSNYGKPQYAHTVGILFAGLDEASKCILSALDNDIYRVALQQTGSDRIEIAGFQFGLGTGDYEYDPTANGGGLPLELTSNENSLENDLPYIYKSAVEGGEVADFDSDFANPTV